MRKFRFLIAIVFLLLAAAPLPARSDFDAGMAAYERGEFETAMTEWLPLAEAGDTKAQYRVGRLHSHGEGVVQNYTTAAHWYERAANKGHIRALFNLGHIFWHGNGLPRNQTKAITWFRKAAVLGDAKAQNHMGTAYSEGLGVEQNEETSVYWFYRSATQGNVNAQGSLSYHYMYGRGVKEDRVKGYMWFTLWLREPTWRTYVSYPFMIQRTQSDQRREAKRLASEWRPVVEK